MCSDDTELACYICSTGPDVFFSRHIIEMYPLDAFTCDDALGTEDLAVLL